MSYAWKLRHENNQFNEWIAPKFKGFATATDEQLIKQNNLFCSTNLKHFIEPYLNKHSNVRVLNENGVITIKVTAVQCCKKGMYKSSKELRFNYSDNCDLLPNKPNFPHYINEAMELAKFLGIEYRN